MKLLFKTKKLICALFAVFCLFISSCEEQPNSTNPQAFCSVIDATGKVVTLQKAPQRIVVAGPTLYAEIIEDLQAFPRVVGISESPNNPEVAKDIPTIGNSLQPNLEQIVALQPDLVLGISGPTRDKLEAGQIPVFLGGNAPYGSISCTQDIFQLVNNVCLLLHGNTEKAEVFVNDTQQKIQDISQKVAKLPTVTACVLYVTPDNSIYVDGKGSISNEVFAKLNVANTFADLATSQINLEVLIQKNPDVIITDPSQIQRLISNPLFSSLKAVQNNTVYGVHASQWTSSRIAQTFQEIVKLLHKTDGN